MLLAGGLSFFLNGLINNNGINTVSGLTDVLLTVFKRAAVTVQVSQY